jgi:GWxTD domain-containing protein
MTYILILLIFCSIGYPKKRTKSLIDKLPKAYKRWLERDVFYLITKEEKNIFLQLKGNSSRDGFIKAFWKNRDPDPNTVVNEFKEEHYKRFNHANDVFGKGTPTPGYKTARGRIWILLGRPNQLWRYEHNTQLVPVVIWFYQGLAKFGLPNAFSVVFFKRNNSGDFQLYSPAQHGPQALLQNFKASSTLTSNVLNQAFRELRQVQPEVANVSLSLIEQSVNQSFVRPAIASDLLIHRDVKNVPKKRINIDYAKKLLRYGGQVDVEYAANYIKNNSIIRVFYNQDGIPFVHFSVEPEKLTLEAYDNFLYTQLEITGDIKTLEGKTIYKFVKKIPIKMSNNKLDIIKQKLFAYRDFFPLIEGEYQFDLLIKNVSSKEFTSIETKLKIPQIDSDKVIMTPPLLVIKKKNTGKDILKAFIIDKTQYSVIPRNDFSRNDKLIVYFQIANADLLDKGSYVKINLKDFNSAILDQKIKNIDENKKIINLDDWFVLNEYKSSYYELELVLYSSDNKILQTKNLPFEISLKENLARAWAVSMAMKDKKQVFLKVIGNQYLNNGQDDKALTQLEKAYKIQPANPDSAMDYCRILFKKGKYNEVVAISDMFKNSKYKNNFLAFYGYSLKNIGKYENAVEYFKKLLEENGTDVNVLNAIGECYYKMENIKEAKIIWNRSLELLPDQPALKKRLKELRFEKK